MVNARRARDGNKVRIVFEFTLEEVTEAEMYNSFVASWSTDKPSVLISFVYSLVRRQRQKAENEERRRQQEELERILRQGQNLGGNWKQFFGFDFGKDESYSASTASNSPPVREPAWCKVLGLSSTATPAEIKTRYRELAKKHHPDAGGTSAEFDRIQSAYKEALQ